jgi:hypothetical protein
VPESSLTSQVSVRVREIHKKNPDAKVIGIRTDAEWQGGGTCVAGDTSFRVISCHSVLEVRAALVNPENMPLVILTDLSVDDLGKDVLARIARRKLYTTDAWVLIKELFQAKEIDPRIKSRKILADAILHTVPTTGYPAVANGFLDEDSAWTAILTHRFGFKSGRPDLVEILEWTSTSDSVARYRSESEQLRMETETWLSRHAGTTAKLILKAVELGYAQDTIPLGLVCEIVLSNRDEPELRAAAARLERFTNHTGIGVQEGQAWYAAASHVINTLFTAGNHTVARRMLERADRILEVVQIMPFAYLGHHSPLGFEHRLEKYGLKLQEFLKAPSIGMIEELYSLRDSIRKHSLMDQSTERVGRVEMSLRLATLLTREPDGEQQSLSDAAWKYAKDGGFIDWARHKLYEGESAVELSKAYGELAEKILRRREIENRQYAALLANWTQSGTNVRSLLTIEEVQKTVVASIAENSPLLLIVIDGMSYAVFRELAEDILHRGWVELSNAEANLPRPVISGLPSITAVSRTSLFAGKLARGVSANEVQFFSNNQDLLNASRNGFPPVLFHKGNLTRSGGSELAPEVIREIESGKRRIVAAVINAVDDHLLKGDQLLVPWALKHLPILEQLLVAARDNDRVVVFTSDHGHVLDRSTSRGVDGVGERFRENDGKPLDGELVVRGTRVLADKNEMIAPWGEDVRYGIKKHGYHGGVSPQETVVPLAVFARHSQALKGWSEISSYRPNWWNIDGAVVYQDVQVAQGTTDSIDMATSMRIAEEIEKFPLFSTPEAQPTLSLSWIDELQQSAVYSRQLKLSGRSAPSAELTRRFLAALDERAGTMLKSALAQRLEQPEFRMQGIIASMRRLLNVDGYDVLAADESSGSVKLNKELMRVQFELE